MRKIIVNSMISLDGVLQAPGAPDEDTSGGFEYGGWTASFGDEEYDKRFVKLTKPSDILLGRKTYDIFAGYWPQHADFWPGINEVTKYAVSHTERSSDWSNTVFLGGLDDIRALKVSGDTDVTVWGSGDLIQTLLENDLVDELQLVIYDRGTIPAAFTVTDGTVTPSGVVFARYTRAGDIVTGTVGPE